MKFYINYNNKIQNRSLSYNVEECSFDTDPLVDEIKFDLVLNYINITADTNNKLVQIWGFCGYKTWVKSNYNVPKYEKGELVVLDNLESGFSYRINNNELPVYANLKTGWLCIGDPEKQGNAVEFINNCVAVIDDCNQFISLWLKPKNILNI